MNLIEYLGITRYSIKENVNNINMPHLYFDIQIISGDFTTDSHNEI